MSSFYDDASLVMIPSGYKNAKIYCEKPTDGSGDLTFTRASNATRVASNGLIEKVRTNLILQSNTFSDAAWTKTRSSIVANSVANPIDGTVNASTLLDTIDNATHLAFQSFTATANPYTFSVYVKANGVNWIQMRVDNGAALQFVYFNLSTGAIGTQNNAVGKITSLGNGWYRCSITATATAASFFAVVQLAEADNDNSYAGTGTNGVYLYASQLELGDIATNYIATTSAAVSVGPVSGLPRLDYLNSSCPRLLLEGQRSNLALWSENFDNAAWSKTQATVTANQAVSPDGYTNADLLVDNSNLSGHVTQQTTISVPSSQAITISGYYKDKDIRYAGLRLFVPTNGTNVGRFSIVVDLQTGAITSTLTSGATIANLSYDVTSVGNGWYRLRITGTSPAGNAGIMAWLSPSATPTNDGFATASYVGTGKGCYLYGFQAELGAYATSYIPTLSTSVTRVADAASKTGISSLIGQTEGVLFLDFIYSNQSLAVSASQLFGISDGTPNERIFIGEDSGTTGKIVVRVIDNNVLQLNIQSSFNMVLGQRYKAAIAYKANDFAFYVNGTQVGTSSTGSVPTMSRIANDSGAGTSSMYYPINQALLFKTRLTNAQLAELTTI